MTKLKIIETRKFFIDRDIELRKVTPSSETSVEFREASYVFHKKVLDLIVEPAKTIFKLPDDVYNKMKEYQHKIYDAGIPFAENAPSKHGEPYKISKEKEKEWLDFSAKIALDYADVIEASNKMDKEYEEWLNKKISLTVNKIPMNLIPSFSHCANNVFLNICALFAEDNSEVAEDDGKEIE